MYYTKNDLSFNKAKLDFQSLEISSGIALRECLENATQYIAKINEIIVYKKPYYPTGISTNARFLKETVDNLVIAAETYTTIIGAKEREEVIIINK